MKKEEEKTNSTRYQYEPDAGKKSNTLACPAVQTYPPVEKSLHVRILLMRE
jgi:hypothetical protein